MQIQGWEVGALCWNPLPNREKLEQRQWGLREAELPAGRDACSLVLGERSDSLCHSQFVFVLVMVQS